MKAQQHMSQLLHCNSVHLHDENSTAVSKPECARLKPLAADMSLRRLMERSGAEWSGMEREWSGVEQNGTGIEQNGAE